VCGLEGAYLVNDRALFQNIFDRRTDGAKARGQLFPVRHECQHSVDSLWSLLGRLKLEVFNAMTDLESLWSFRESHQCVNQ